jgi:hypothetical protein
MKEKKMKRYWDLSKKERAHLTQEELNRFCDVHLMEEGVVVSKLTLEEVPEEPEVPMETGYRLQHESEGYTSTTSIVFKNEKDAATFMNLKGLRVIVYEYETKRDCLVLLERPSIQPISMPRKVDLAEMKGSIRTINEIKDRNKAAEREYKEQLKKKEEVIQPLVDDYQECRDLDHLYETIHKTLIEYMFLAENNKDIAMGFLKKAYSEENIKNMIEWEDLSKETFQRKSSSGAITIGNRIGGIVINDSSYEETSNAEA